MFLGFADGWVAAAYCANVAATLLCVVYGAVRFNADDDGEEQ